MFGDPNENAPWECGDNESPVFAAPDMDAMYMDCMDDGIPPMYCDDIPDIGDICEQYPLMGDENPGAMPPIPMLPGNPPYLASNPLRKKSLMPDFFFFDFADSFRFRV